MQTWYLINTTKFVSPLWTSGQGLDLLSEGCVRIKQDSAGDEQPVELEMKFI